MLIQYQAFDFQHIIRHTIVNYSFKKLFYLQEVNKFTTQKYKQIIIKKILYSVLSTKQKIIF